MKLNDAQKGWACLAIAAVFGFFVAGLWTAEKSLSDKLWATGLLTGLCAVLVVLLLAGEDTA